ncbi:MAG: bifunctional oligoribonuclease/PAP phosphatase NrnA [Deltaproteobacteria bacterium]|nr:bifunctional oligoribonuclease/PAP phosphatase NrnA [Deltaproteobacteria bacterium]
MYERAAQYVQQCQRIVIASHANPDGDAIGSTLALGIGLLSLGKQVVMFNADGVPRSLRFLPYADRIVRSLSGLAAPDGLILVDCAQPRRAGKPIEDLARTAPPFYIDHHLLPGIRHEDHCIDPRAAATGAVLFALFRAMRIGLSPELAKLLYCTLVVDTGFFRYSNTSPEVLHLAGDLVAAGADPWEVASQIEENYSAARMPLLQLVLETLELSERGRFAHVTLTLEMLREAQALPEDAEDFVNYPRAITGVEVAALFRQQDLRRWKASLRSKMEVDVAAITARFGGGGHEHAAGCTIEGDLATVRKQIGDEIRKALQRRQGQGNPRP